MIRPRVIPVLLVDQGALVKTTRFSTPKYVGDPLNAVRVFNEKEVDELVVLDISAAKLGREPDLALIEQLAEECFMPLCYGGGITSADEASRIVGLGVEKVAFGGRGLADPRFVAETVSLLGSQSVVMSLDAERSHEGSAYWARSSTWTSRRRVPLDVAVDEAVALNVGEVLLTAVRREGTSLGPDLDLVSHVCDRSPIPVVYQGGIRDLEDMNQALRAGASGVGIGTAFVLYGPHRAVLITYPSPEEVESLGRRNGIEP